MGDNEYYTLMQSLNEKQRRNILQILYCVRTDQKLPTYNIITLSGARVGKSRLIEAICHTLLQPHYEQKDNHKGVYVLKKPVILH